MSYCNKYIINIAVSEVAWRKDIVLTIYLLAICFVSCASILSYLRRTKFVQECIQFCLEGSSLVVEM